MSDSPFVFGDVPPEVAQEIHRRIDLSNMARKDWSNQVHEFLDSLSPAYLVTLRDMMHQIGPDGSTFPAYYEGKIGSILRYKYDACEGCGERHEEDIFDHDAPVKLSGDEEPASDGTVQMTIDDIIANAENAPVPIFENLPQLLEAYNLRYPDNGEVESAEGEPQPFICLGCGTLYQSIEDRMLKPVGMAGCEGCIHKQKWG